jgi:predicted HTH domain antitoxin
MTTVHVTVDLPTDGKTPAAELAQELRLLWVLEQVRMARISLGKGAELAATDRWAFMEIMAEHGIPVMAYPASDLDRELAALEGR